MVVAFVAFVAFVDFLGNPPKITDRAASGAELEARVDRVMAAGVTAKQVMARKESI
jgi:hypothetical protein